MNFFSVRLQSCIGWLSVILALVASMHATAWGQEPYIATSQNYYCAESENEVTMYCNVLAFDPNTNVDEWTFAWSPANEVSNPTGQLVTISPENTTSYSVEMVAPDGSIYEDEITITVYPFFSVITDPEVAICSTVGGQLEATVDVADAMNWQWEPATGLSNASISNPQVLAELTQTYTVTATISGLGGASCTASAQVDLISIFPDMELGEDVVAEQAVDAAREQQVAELRGREPPVLLVVEHGDELLPHRLVVAERALEARPHSVHARDRRRLLEPRVVRAARDAPCVCAGLSGRIASPF